MVADDPTKSLKDSTDESTRLLPKLLPEFVSLNSELLLVPPYFVPGDAGVDHLRALVQRGVKVRILTNSLASTDVPAVYAGYKRYRRALLEAGVELHEIKAAADHTVRHDRPSGSRDDEDKSSLTGSSHASLHAKTMAFDRRALFVGSMNLDPRSVFTNTEIGVVVEHPGLVPQRIETIDSRLPEISYRLELTPAAGPDSQAARKPRLPPLGERGVQLLLLITNIQWRLVRQA